MDDNTTTLSSDDKASYDLAYKGGRVMKVKNTKLILSVTIVLAVGIAFFIFYPNAKKESITTTSTQPHIVYNEADLAYDTGNINVAVGYADNVFVAKVLKVEGTYAQKNSNGTSDPMRLATMYRLKVIENVKGTLSMSKPVLIYKDGGALPDGTIALNEGDNLPETNSYYLFTASVEGGAPAGITPSVPNGSLFVSGANSSVLLDKDEAKALKSGKITEFSNVLKTQVTTDRQRYSIKANEVYLNN